MAARYDNQHRRLRTGETQKKNGDYTYRWTDKSGMRHSFGATSLEELRQKEEELSRQKLDGIKQNAGRVTLNDIFELWKRDKRGLKDNTLQNYCWTYEQYVRENIGLTPIQQLKRSEIKRFYNQMFDERHLKISTIDNIHTVLHQVLNIAVDDDYIRKNISDNLLKELKKSHVKEEKHRRALTVSEQMLFLDYIGQDSCRYNHFYPIFAVMLGAGLRVGEVTGLRWEDVDLDEGTISVNHTLVYYCHRDQTGNNCYFAINTPKTKAGERIVPMTEEVKIAFMKEKEYQERNNLTCCSEVDGFTDFIFINRFGKCQHQGTLNKALRRIIRDCNDRQFENYYSDQVFLPNFSCHSLRHTFVTRLIEAGVSIPVVQKLAGHSRSDVTLDIYTTVTKEFKNHEFKKYQELMKNKKDTWKEKKDNGKNGD